MEGFNVTRALEDPATLAFADRLAAFAGALAGASTPSAIAAPRQGINASTGKPKRRSLLPGGKGLS